MAHLEVKEMRALSAFVARVAVFAVPICLVRQPTMYQSNVNQMPRNLVLSCLVCLIFLPVELLDFASVGIYRIERRGLQEAWCSEVGMRDTSA